MADRIQLRRDTAANWTAYNPILLEGEPGIEIDTDQWKLGDGVHTWSQLAYRGGECVQQRGQSTTVAMSQKAVTDELNLIGVFDISAHNLTDGQPTKYADLTAALGTNGANVPTQYRVPGMTVRYVQSSDNKYVQFRYMSSSTAVADFINVANWQGVDDEPTAGSDNLVKSGGVNELIGELCSYKDVISVYSPSGNISLDNKLTQGNKYILQFDLASSQTMTITLRTGARSVAPVTQIIVDNKALPQGHNIFLFEYQSGTTIRIGESGQWSSITNVKIYNDISKLVAQALAANIGTIDSKPTQGSNNLVKSSGVKEDSYLGNRTVFPVKIPKTDIGLILANGNIDAGYTNWNIYSFDIPNGTEKIYISISGTTDLNQSAYALGRFVLSNESVVAIPSPYPTLTAIVNYEVTVPSNATKIQLATTNGAITVSRIVSGRYVQINTQYETYKITDIKNEVDEVKENSTVNLNLLIDYFKDNHYFIITNGKADYGPQNSWKVGSVDVSEYVGKTLRINCVSKSETNTSNIGHCFFDSNDDAIGTPINVKPSQNPIEVTVPNNAVKLLLNCFKTVSGDNSSVLLLNAGLEKALQQFEEQIESVETELDNKADKTALYYNNQWRGKKILWLGTSIPWGQTNEVYPTGTHRAEHPYPQQVCAALGATLVDSTHGGLAQMANYDSVSGKWYPKNYGSTCLTISECQEAYSAGLVSADLSEFSYENTLLGKNAELYVFDVEPNNEPDGSAADLALFDWRLWKYTDDSTFASHRDTYVGALIYEIDQLLTEKPNAIIVFVGEHNKLQLSNYTEVPYQIRVQSEALCDKFHIGYINLAKKLFYVGKNLLQWVNDDNVHPKQAAYDRIAKMLINELLLIA